MVVFPLTLFCGLHALPGWLSGLSQDAGNNLADKLGMIVDDGHFYGQSPPVYPSRKFFKCDWEREIVS